jgi:hypothetical protein
MSQIAANLLAFRAFREAHGLPLVDDSCTLLALARVLIAGRA